MFIFNFSCLFYYTPIYGKQKRLSLLFHNRLFTTTVSRFAGMSACAFVNGTTQIKHGPNHQRYNQYQL